MALPCITAAQISGLFHLLLASSANLQDSQLQVFQDQAFCKLPLKLLLANLTSQLLHHPSPQIHYRDWNSANLSNKTLRIDLLFKGVNQALQQQKISPFHTESTTHYRKTNLSVGLLGIHNLPVRNDTWHCVCALHAPLTSRSPSWQSPSVTIPFTWAVCKDEMFREILALLTPLDWSQEALDFNEGCSCKVLIWIQISQSSAQMI